MVCIEQLESLLELLELLLVNHGLVLGSYRSNIVNKSFTLAWLGDVRRHIQIQINYKFEIGGVLGFWG